jgi:hypothetical protein
MMNRYQHKSGSKKRKERAAKAESIKQGQTLLSEFFIPSEEHECSSNQSNADLTIVSHDIDDCVTYSDSPMVTGESSHENADEPPQNSSSMTSDNSDIPLLDSLESSSSKPTAPFVILPVANSNVTENISITSVGQLNDFDIRKLEEVTPNINQIHNAVQRGHLQHPTNFPRDETGRAFPCPLMHTQLNNAEKILRDWLVRSIEKQSLFCFCCRLFYSGPEQSKPSLELRYKVYVATCENYTKKYLNIRRVLVISRVILKWRKLEKTIAKSATIDIKLDQSIRSEILKWKLILVRSLDITLFLVERGLPFRGVNEKLGNPNNRLFLGICELLARYDKVLELHLAAVKEAQDSSRRMQVTYLSKETQNDYLMLCQRSPNKAFEGN